VLPVIRDEIIVEKRQDGESQPRGTLSREDVEWLLHLDVCGDAWTEAFLGGDEKTGETVARCVAAHVGLRLGYAVAPRNFQSLVTLWKRWVKAWELGMDAVPTGRLV
jgi:hypothetical protein